MLNELSGEDIEGRGARPVGLVQERTYTPPDPKGRMVCTEVPSGSILKSNLVAITNS